MKKELGQVVQVTIGTTGAPATSAALPPPPMTIGEPAPVIDVERRPRRFARFLHITIITRRTLSRPSGLPLIRPLARVTSAGTGVRVYPGVFPIPLEDARTHA